MMRYTFQLLTAKIAIQELHGEPVFITELKASRKLAIGFVLFFYLTFLSLDASIRNGL